MRSDRRSLLVAGLALSAVGGLPSRAQTAPPAAALPLPGGTVDPVETIDLWPGGAPGAPALLPTEVTTERSEDPTYSDRAVKGVSVPRLAVFRPAKPNGAGVLLMPGGGYNHVVVDKEGYEMGRWLAARGITAFVLFYRLPYDGWAAGPNVALSDAQRAMRIIRHRANEFDLQPDRVAAMGFSAGGHLCADLATRFDARTYAPVDAADALSARPHCAAPIYPVISMQSGAAHAGSRTRLLGDDPSAEVEIAHSPHLNVPADAPPVFLLHAEDDDAVPVENSLLFRAALKERNIPVETHLYEAGGHGFGLRRAAGKPVEIWPDLWLSWARAQGLV